MPIDRAAVRFQNEFCSLIDLIAATRNLSGNFPVDRATNRQRRRILYMRECVAAFCAGGPARGTTRVLERHPEIGGIHALPREVFQGLETPGCLPASRWAATWPVRRTGYRRLARGPEGVRRMMAAGCWELGRD